jgi:putative FmdB family regulatory protein
MPLYEFECQQCHHRFTVLRRIDHADSEGPACPACGAEESRRVPSAFASRSSSPSAGAAPPSCGPSGFS